MLPKTYQIQQEHGIRDIYYVGRQISASLPIQGSRNSRTETNVGILRIGIPASRF